MRKSALLLLSLLALALPAPAQPDHNKLDVHGTVTGLSPQAGMFTLLSDRPWTVRVDARTEYKGVRHDHKGGDSRNCGCFFYAAEGSYAKVEGTLLQDGTLLAREVKLQGGEGRGRGRDRERDDRGQARYPAQPGYPAHYPLQVTNLTPGMQVPGNFNVQGVAAPGSQIQVQVKGQQDIIPGVVSIDSGGFLFRGVADQNGNFNVPVNMGMIPAGTRLQVNVHAHPSNEATQLWVVRN